MTVYGVDVSKYQKGLDLASVKKQGYVFVAAKCTEGRGYADPQYPVFLAAAKKADLLFAAYHFLRSDSPASVQAANLAAHIRDKSIPVMIDCEPSGSSKPKISHVLAFIAECKKRGLKVTLLYYPSFWWSSSGRPKLPSSVGLWQARYPKSTFTFASVLYPGDKGNGWASQGGQTPDIWQFASSGKISGYGAKVDVNAFRGTLTQLKESGFFKDWTPEPIKPAPHPAPKPAPKPVPVPVVPVPVPTPPVTTVVSLSDDTIQKIAEAVRLKIKLGT
jgi:lysozyme